MQCVLAISGGIGITPMQSVSNELLHLHARGRPLKKLHFVWSARDRSLLGSMAGSSELPYNATPALPQPFTPNLLHRLGSARICCADADADGGGGRDDFDNGEVLNSEFFLTQVEAHTAMGTMDPGLQAHVRFGRPDLAKAFGSMKRVAARAGQARVAVLVCGPPGMVSDVRALCIRCSDKEGLCDSSSGLSGSSTVQFDFHSEEFAL